MTDSIYRSWLGVITGTVVGMFIGTNVYMFDNTKRVRELESKVAALESVREQIKISEKNK